MRSITEFDSSGVSEYLVRQGLVGLEKARLKESARVIKSSLIEEWKGKVESHKISLILKSPVIRTTLLIFTLVSLRYFKTEWDESE